MIEFDPEYMIPWSGEVNQFLPFLHKYKGKILRKWDAEQATGKGDFGTTVTWSQAKPVECEYIFITDSFDVGNRIMVEYHAFDAEYENGMYPSAHFDFLDDIKLEFVPSDMDMLNTSEEG